MIIESVIAVSVLLGLSITYVENEEREADRKAAEIYRQGMKEYHDIITKPFENKGE